MSLRPMKPEGLDLHTPRAGRSTSFSSDVRSMSARSTATCAPPPNISPAPIYIETAAAANLISTETGDQVTVSTPALTLLNAFLDQILFDLLAAARSTSLSRLRSAVPVVLKPRLGKAALQSADEELKEYLDDVESEEQQAGHPESGTAGHFDLELAWKLARLRCMVYTRLGDLEEEDEEEYIEHDQLQEQSNALGHAASRASSVKPAAAIFLTSILEFLGEQALYYAAQGAQRRAHLAQSKEAAHGTPSLPKYDEGLLLEEADMLQLGREGPLSRLWRSWRKQIRMNPRDTASSPMSPDWGSPTADSPLHTRDNSMAAAYIGAIDEETSPPPSVDEMLKLFRASQVPLPMSEDDVREIEVPGLAKEIVDDEQERPEATLPTAARATKRRNSLSTEASLVPGPLTPSPSHRQLNQRSRNALHMGRTRSHSLPTPAQSPVVAHARDDANDPVSVDPREAHDGAITEPTKQDDEAEDAVAPSSAPGVKSKGTEPQPRDRTSHIDRTVAAIAGALGAGGLLTSYKQPSPSEAQAAKEAEIGASITTAGDFGNLHIPVARHPVEHRRGPEKAADTSDPEDLALSSGDEDGERKAPPSPTPTDGATQTNARGIASPATPKEPASTNHRLPIQHTRELSEDGELLPIQHTREMDDGESPSSPRSKRDAMIFPDDTTASLAGPEPARQPPLSDDRPDKSASLYQMVTVPGPATTAEGYRDMGAEPDRPPSSSIAGEVPLRYSSNDRTRVGHSSAASESSQYSQRSSSSSKLLGFTRDQHGHPQPLASQRVEAPAPAPAPSAYRHRPGSSNATREMRPGTASSHRSGLRRLSSSEEEEAEAKKKSLEILINSDETLHYTLTPVSARAEEFPHQQNAPSLRDFGEHAGSSSQDGERPRTARSSLGINGLRLNPTSIASPSPPLRMRTPPASALPVHRAPASPASPGKAKGVQARDPRLDKNTTRDLADYARSTGPERETQLAQPLGSRPGSSATTKASLNLSEPPPVPVAAVLVPTVRPAPSKPTTRIKFEAREPTISRHAESNDLIDFLRDGPPREPGEERSGRHADDVNGFAGRALRDDNGRSSGTSTLNSSVPQSSLNSRTGLLDSSKRANASAGNGGRGPSVRAVASQESGTLVRKQRRVRDPYAIDDSDDELDEEATATPRAATQDESLIDFLRNTAPPSGATPKPILSAAAAAALAHKESSNPSLRTRPAQKTSTSPSGGTNGQASPAPAQATERAAENHSPPTHTRATNGNGARARAESPHLSQKGKKLDEYAPTKPTHAAHVDRVRQTVRPGEPREPTRGGRSTADLADYLRNSGPAVVASTPSPPEPRGAGKEDAGFMKFFSRKKSAPRGRMNG